MAKEKMSLEKKAKLIYSGELLLFTIVFFVIATLEVLNIIGKREIVLIIFNWVTIFGATWMLVDFFWVIFSKKRRARNSLVDKALLVPAAIYLIAFDIICFTKASFVTMEFRRLMMGIVFYYLGATYLFQAIYHWFKPIPALLEDIELEKQELEKEKLEKEDTFIETLTEEIKQDNKEKKTDE